MAVVYICELIQGIKVLPGSTPILRTLSLRPIMGKRSVYVKA